MSVVRVSFGVRWRTVPHVELRRDRFSENPLRRMFGEAPDAALFLGWFVGGGSWTSAASASKAGRTTASISATHCSLLRTSRSREVRERGNSPPASSFTRTRVVARSDRPSSRFRSIPRGRRAARSSRWRLTRAGTSFARAASSRPGTSSPSTCTREPHFPSHTGTPSRLHFVRYGDLRLRSRDREANCVVRS